MSEVIPEAFSAINTIEEQIQRNEPRMFETTPDIPDMLQRASEVFLNGAIQTKKLTPKEFSEFEEVSEEMKQLPHAYRGGEVRVLLSYHQLDVMNKLVRVLKVTPWGQNFDGDLRVTFAKLNEDFKKSTQYESPVYVEYMKGLIKAQ